MVGKLSTYNSAHFRVFGVMAGARRGRVIRFFVDFVFLVSPKTVPLLAMRSVVEPDGKMKTNKKMEILPYHSTVIVASLSIRFCKKKGGKITNLELHTIQGFPETLPK